MKRFATGILIMATVLALACGALAETVYLSDLGWPVEAEEIKVTTIGSLTKNERLVDQSELEPVEGVEDLYALTLSEEESATYKSVKYGNFTYKGLDRSQNLYAVRLQSQGIAANSVWRLELGSTVLFSEEKPNEGELDFMLACPESFVLELFGAYWGGAAYSGIQVSKQQIDLSGTAVGETLTVKQQDSINSFKPFTLQLTKVALLQEAVPSYTDTLADGPFTLYFLDIGLDPANARITTSGYKEESGSYAYQTRTLDDSEYTFVDDAPEGVIAVTFDPQTFEADGYTYNHLSLTMQEDVDAPTLESTANRAQELTDGLYLYSAKISGIKDEDLSNFIIRQRSIDNPSKYTTLSSIFPATQGGAERTLIPGELFDQLYFVSGDIVQFYLGRYIDRNSTHSPSWELAESFAPEGLAVGESFETTIKMSGTDVGNHDDITIIITKEAILRDPD